MDPIPEVRSVAARALGSLIRGMGEDNFPDLVPWLFETLKSENSNVERSGAAQGLSEVGLLSLFLAYLIMCILELGCVIHGFLINVSISLCAKWGILTPE